MSVARTIECFYPGDSFPAISITGRACSMNCKHCGKKYLEGMVPATTPGDLLEIAEALAQRGANGFLLSGGADPLGKVKLANYAEAISEIKSSTDLKINAHIGLTSTSDINRLVESGIDAFSVDVYGSDETIHEVLGLDAEVRDYHRVLDDLEHAGAKIVAPHICIGIHGGELRGEFDAIKALKSHAPKTLILISLIPTKGTAYQDVAAPSASDIISVVRNARESLPRTRLLLGCMRSKLDRSHECGLVAAGLDGIVLPANSTVERLIAEGYRIRKRSVCCSIG
ncbi:MAG: hypothetical protein A3K76_01755 [Euryarchaeota archaeon RBG_13_57_23]|nr:MAG: hypothetical protein A3K76_01755 [Euryarchaeota archaeon RBG_13_57_23]